MRLVMLLVLGLSVCLSMVSCENDGLIDVDIKTPDLSDLEWGEHQLHLTITSKAEDLHFIVVRIQADFPGIYGSDYRRTQVNAMLMPGEELEIHPSVVIPGNYGQARVSVTVYDVVDTLDVLMSKYVCWQEDCQVDFDPPSAIEPYRSTPIQLPPRVADHPYFDSELPRLMLLLIDDHKTEEEIVSLTGADSGMVAEVLSQLMSRNDVRSTDDGLRVLFPIIGQEQIAATEPIIDDLVEDLVTRVKENWDDYEGVIDSLVTVGAMTADTNLTMDAGAVLHHRFPTVGCLLLWHELGRKFITRSAPLVIYDKTDLCDANIATYMYAASATSEQNGKHNFLQTLGRGGYSINYADWPLGILCEEQFLRKVARGSRVNLSYEDGSKAMTHTFDTSTVRPAIEALAGGIDSLLYDTYEQVRDIAVKYKHARLDYGQRYWFWNVVATRTLDRLVAEGFVTRPESGHVRLQSFRKRNKQ